MDDLERFKVMLYQYILCKADFYKNRADSLLFTVRSKKHPSSEELQSLFLAQLKNEIFDDFFREIDDILRSFR